MRWVHGCDMPEPTIRQVSLAMQRGAQAEAKECNVVGSLGLVIAKWTEAKQKVGSVAHAAGQEDVFDGIALDPTDRSDRRLQDGWGRR